MTVPILTTSIPLEVGFLRVIETMNKQLSAIHLELGLPADYPSQCQMSLQEECTALVCVEPDVFGRPAQLDAAAASAWQLMKNAAQAEGISLQLVSAYRSYAYQQALFVRKLEKGAQLSDILKVNAAPGYSEHHSGRAIDLGCPGYRYLEEDFEQSPAFDWLQQHAGRFGFRMSFGRENSFGVLYEPWHWYYLGTQ